MNKTKLKKGFYIAVLILCCIVTFNLNRLSDEFVTVPEALSSRDGQEKVEIIYDNPNDDESVADEAFRKYIRELRKNDKEYRESIDLYVDQKYRFVQKGKLLIAFLLIINAFFAISRVEYAKWKRFVRWTTVITIIASFLTY